MFGHNVCVLKRIRSSYRWGALKNVIAGFSELKFKLQNYRHFDLERPEDSQSLHFTCEKTQAQRG